MEEVTNNQYQDDMEMPDAAANECDIKPINTAQINDYMGEDKITIATVPPSTETFLDSDTIQHTGNQPDSVRNCFNIFIKTEDNCTHELNVHFSNSSATVKNMIQQLLQIAEDDQRLVFNGNELKNDDILTEKMIKPGSTIDLFLSNLTLKIHRSDQVECIEIPRKSTIAQLKKMLMEKYDVPIGFQILFYNNRVLNENEKTIFDYNIGNLSEIYFRPNDIEIFIQLESIGRDRISLRFLPVDTIGQVKDKIQAETNINKIAQQLIWNGRVLDNDAILSYEHIHSGSTLSLLVSVQNLQLNVQVGPEDRISIEVRSTDTLLQLKKKLFEKTKIPVDQQTLYNKNIKLEDQKMLIDYGLNPGSNIAMERKDSFDILIQSFTGKKASIRVQKEDDVDFIRDEIDRRLGVSPEYQVLNYGGKQLQSGKLKDYQIEKGSTVVLTTRVHGGGTIY